MSKRKRILAACSISLLMVLSLVAVPYCVPDPSTKANSELIQVGLPFSEVESILGKAGGNYSSPLERDYHIWKGREGWIRVWSEQGKVTATGFDPGLPMDEDQTVFGRLRVKIRTLW